MTGSDWFGSNVTLVQATNLVAIEVMAGVATIAPLAMNNLGDTPLDGSKFLSLVPCPFLVMF